MYEALADQPSTGSPSSGLGHRLVGHPCRTSSPPPSFGGCFHSPLLKVKGASLTGTRIKQGTWCGTESTIVPSLLTPLPTLQSSPLNSKFQTHPKPPSDLPLDSFSTHRPPRYLKHSLQIPFSYTHPPTFAYTPTFLPNSQTYLIPTSFRFHFSRRTFHIFPQKIYHFLDFAVTLAPSVGRRAVGFEASSSSSSFVLSIPQKGLIIRW